MGIASEQYEAAARRWGESGRPEPEADGWHLMTLSCWMTSAGGRHDGASDTLKAYADALRRSVERTDPDWLDDLFDGHEYCSFCGQSWRAENCSVCTHCLKAWPPCCADRRRLTVLANGNRECRTCGQGEVVG
jgi:hypothetical protein